MKTLMHICCAPCANQPIEVLRTDGIEVAGFWYNPNIHPVTEYRARRNCLEAYAKEIELPLIMKNDYALRPFVRAVAEDIAHRCGKCYEMRLFETAKTAAEGGFDSFTSSLFISPYQNHELMREVAERAASEFGVQFLYGISRLTSRTVRISPGSMASICRNTAAAFSPRRSVISRRKS